MKTIPIRFNFDTDRDGVPDWKDCRPFDYRKQHVKRRVRREVDELGVGIAYEEDEKWNVAPISSKKAREKHPRLVETVYSTFNRYPGLSREIKEREEQWRKKESVPLLLGQSFKEFEESIGERVPYHVTYPEDVRDDRYASSQGGRIISFDVPVKSTSRIQNNKNIKIRKQDVIAHGIFHELKHEDQALDEYNNSRQSEYDKYKKEWDEEYKDVDISKLSPEEQTECATSYYENPFEEEAEEFAIKKSRERLQPIKNIEKRFGKISKRWDKY